jgi:hypothetical protein
VSCVFIKDSTGSGDPLVRAGVLLEIPDRKHQCHPRVGACFSHGGRLAGTAQGRNGKTEQSDGDDSQQDQQTQCDY